MSVVIFHQQQSNMSDSSPHQKVKNYSNCRLLPHDKSPQRESSQITGWV